VIVPNALLRLKEVENSLFMGDFPSITSTSSRYVLSSLRDSLKGVEDFKISDTEVFGTIHNIIYFVDFKSICSIFLLDNPAPPSEHLSAIIGYCILQPTPGEIYQFIPPLAFISDPNLRKLYTSSKDTPPYIDIDTEPPLSAIHALFEKLDKYYPPLAGRAGKKSNLSVQDLERIVRGLGKGILRTRLLRMATALCICYERLPNNWGGLVATSFCLVHFMSGEMFRVHFLLLQLITYPTLSDVNALAKTLKNLHHLFRVCKLDPFSNQSLTDDQVRQLYGIDVIIGRHDLLEYDAKKDILTRLIDPTLREIISPNDGIVVPDLLNEFLVRSTRLAVYSAAGLEDHPTEATNPIRGLPQRNFNLETFRHWYNRRFYWAAAGGAPGANINWDSSSNQRERLNKRGALMFIPADHFISEYANNLQPVMYSKAAPKYENGKIRTIWNTSMEFYIAQAYVLDLFEISWVSGTWNTAANYSVDELIAQRHRLYQLKTRYGYGLMWDYSDFNINHTFSVMNLLFSEVFKLIRYFYKYKTDISSDEVVENQHILNDIEVYLRKSRTHTILFDPISGIEARVVRSMQSGERATSFQNTFLSRIYKLTADLYAERFFGRTLLKPISYHQGDDVFCYANSISDGVLASYVFNILGYAGQQHKITLDYSNRGEFLRYDYIVDDALPTMVGYPARSFMGLLGGEFFLDSVVDPGDRAMAFVDQVDNCSRRGCCLPKVLLDRLIERNCALSYTDYFNGKPSTTRVTVPFSLIQTPAVFGGYGTSASNIALSEFKHSSEFRGRPQYMSALRNFSELTLLLYQNRN